MTRCAGILQCPVCDEPLSEVDRSFRCPRGHTFDRAREGYVHLLPAGHGRSKIRGDTRQMVRARRRFLERGHYEPLSRAINALALSHLAGAGASVHHDAEAGCTHSGEKRESGSDRVATAPGKMKRGEAVPGAGERLEAASPAATVLEVGCGEGYYIGRLARAVSSSTPDWPSCFIGLDVSKDAVRLAARSYRDVLFLVNDVKHRINVADRRVNVLLDIFAPRNLAEFGRVLRPNGLLIVAIPGEDHLAELRERLPLLGIQPEKRERTIEQFADGFDLVAQEALTYPCELEAEETVDLLGMTPNYWHLDEATLAAVATWGRTSVTVDVRVLGFRRRG